MPFEVVPCVRIEEFGDACAPVVCERLKIKSQNDKVKLEEAKHQTYLKGFTDGIMLLGEFAGEAVKEVKPLIKDDDDQPGTPSCTASRRSRCEPLRGRVRGCAHGPVVPRVRRGGWRARAEKCLAGMNTYHDEARRAFESTLGWLRQWACSRNFGLGTRVPWDESSSSSRSATPPSTWRTTRWRTCCRAATCTARRAQRGPRADDGRRVGRGVPREAARLCRERGAVPRGVARRDEGGV